MVSVVLYGSGMNLCDGLGLRLERCLGNTLHYMQKLSCNPKSHDRAVAVWGTP